MTIGCVQETDNSYEDTTDSVECGSMNKMFCDIEESAKTYSHAISDPDPGVLAINVIVVLN